MMVRTTDGRQRQGLRGRHTTGADNRRGERRGVRIQEAVRISEGNREKNTDTLRSRPLTSRMTLRTVVFMMLIITAMTAALIYYIKLQADVTESAQEIAELEEELTGKKAENDAMYNEINDSISLEEIREKAINELGMKYADRDQVVIYSGDEEDSVHQISEIDGQ